jgi:hypothetical protein
LAPIALRASVSLLEAALERRNRLRLRLRSSRGLRTGANIVFGRSGNWNMEYGKYMEYGM